VKSLRKCREVLKPDKAPARLDHYKTQSTLKLQLLHQESLLRLSALCTETPHINHKSKTLKNRVPLHKRKLLKQTTVVVEAQKPVKLPKQKIDPEELAFRMNNRCLTQKKKWQKIECPEV
jgi:hypothetical protein